MIKTLEYNQIDSEKWNELLYNSETSSIFQTKDCYDFYCRLRFLKPFLIGVEENEELTGICCGYIISDGNVLMKYFSRRAIIPGGVLLSKNCSKEAIAALLTSIKKTLNRLAIYVEIRNFNNYFNHKTTFENNYFKYKPHLNVQVSTTDKAQLFSKINKNKLKQVRLSKENGAICEQTKNPEDIKKLYLILRELYKKKVKTPLFPLDFFLELTKTDFSKIFVVKRNNEILGGIVTVVYDEKKVYEWFVCGIDKMTGIYPSTLATFSVIEYAADNGFDMFDFMGAGKPNQKYGVKDFKSKFGGEVHDQGRFLCINNLFLYHLGKTFITIIKKKKRYFK